MPELPDVTIYVEAMRARILGRTLDRVAVRSPFLMRSADRHCRRPGRTVLDVHRLGKRIAIGLDGDLWLVLHLMIAAGCIGTPPRPSSQPQSARLFAFDSASSG